MTFPFLFFFPFVLFVFLPFCPYDFESRLSTSTFLIFSNSNGLKFKLPGQFMLLSFKFVVLYAVGPVMSAI